MKTPAGSILTLLFFLAVVIISIMRFARVFRRLVSGFRTAHDLRGQAKWIRAGLLTTGALLIVLYEVNGFEKHPILIGHVLVIGMLLFFSPLLIPDLPYYMVNAISYLRGQSKNDLHVTDVRINKSGTSA